MDTSDLANRMKGYEKRNQYYLQKRTPVAIRVDGRSFHTFTKGFKRPFDEVLMKTMQETAKYMCENIQGAKLAYVQSDEITIILVDYDTLETDCWFNYRTDKICSIAASMATMKFNQIFSKNVKDFESTRMGIYMSMDRETRKETTNLIDIYYKAIDKGAMFDARCFNIPKEEVANLIYWRQLDATRNSIQMVGQANFSHSELQNKSCNMIQDMLLIQKDINWNHFPTDCKRGAACYKETYMIDVNGDRIKGVIAPSGHMTYPGVYGKDSQWVIDRDMPIIKNENRKYVEKYIYVGEGM